MKNKLLFMLLMVLVMAIIGLMNWQDFRAIANTVPNIYLPIMYKAKPVPNSPSLHIIDNSDQNNFFTVSWEAVEYAVSYQLQEAVDPLFSNTIDVYQGVGLSWTVSYPGRMPNSYYYRVRAINEAGVSPWSNVQQVTIRPLFISLYARWDSNGYIRGNENYNLGYHEIRNLDLLTPGDNFRSNNQAWYDPNLFSWPYEYWYSYYDVASGEFISSSDPGDPSWKWVHDWLLAYSLQFQNGQTVYIDNQAFIVSGPISGYTSFGTSVQYWEFVNRDQFLFWDDGGNWKQYVNKGEAILRYDAGNSRLLLYANVKRHYYYQGNPYPETVQYIDLLIVANSIPGGFSFGITPSASIPEVTISGLNEINDPLSYGPRR